MSSVAGFDAGDGNGSGGEALRASVDNVVSVVSLDSILTSDGQCQDIVEHVLYERSSHPYDVVRA